MKHICPKCGRELGKLTWCTFCDADDLKKEVTAAGLSVIVATRKPVRHDE